MTNNLHLKIKIVIYLSLIPIISFAQTQPVLEWGHGMGGNLDDVGREILVDNDKNVIITCEFNSTVDFDPSATGVTNLTSCGFLHTGFAKYDSLGNLIWAKSLCGNQGTNFPEAMAIDDHDNIYITGYFSLITDFDPGSGVSNLDPVLGGDIFLSKYDSSGNLVWAHNIGNNFSSNTGTDVTLDHNGALYITGYFQDTVDFDPGPGNTTLISLGDMDFYLVKFDTSGIFQWVTSAGSNNIVADTWGHGVATDDQGNVYCTGTFNDMVDFNPGPALDTITTHGTNDIFISKYDSNGNFQWVKRIGGTEYDESRGIVVSPSGNIDITGLFGGTVDFDPGTGTANATAQGNEDIFILQLDASGNFNWAMQAGDFAWDRTLGIATDASSNIYITGFFQGTVDFDPGPGTSALTSTTISDRDVFMTKYDDTGVHVWSTSFGGPIREYGFNISVDDQNSVYVTGHFKGTADLDPSSAVDSVTSNGGFDMFFAKFDQNATIGFDEAMIGSTYSFSIYPNPFNSNAYAELINGTPGENNKWFLTLFDIAGKELIKYETTSSRISIDRGSLQSGLYFYKVETNEGILHSGKLVLIEYDR